MKKYDYSQIANHNAFAIAMGPAWERRLYVNGCAHEIHTIMKHDPKRIGMYETNPDFHKVDYLACRSAAYLTMGGSQPDHNTMNLRDAVRHIVLAASLMEPDGEGRHTNRDLTMIYLGYMLTVHGVRTNDWTMKEYAEVLLENLLMKGEKARRAETAANLPMPKADVADAKAPYGRDAWGTPRPNWNRN